MIKTLKKILTLNEKIPWPLLVFGGIIAFLLGIYYTQAPSRKEKLSDIRLAELETVKKYLDEPNSDIRKRNLQLLQLYLPDIDLETLNSLTNHVDENVFNDEAKSAYQKIIQSIKNEIRRVENKLDTKEKNLQLATQLLEETTGPDLRILNVNIEMIKNDIDLITKDLNTLKSIQSQLVQ